MSQLGLNRWGVRHGLAVKLEMRNLDAPPQEGWIQGSPEYGAEWYDVQASLELYQNVYEFRGIKSRPIWQDRSTLNIPWQYYAMTLQLSDVARAAGVPEEELPDRRPGWREGYARRVLVARCLVDHALHASGDIWGEHTAINQLGERRFRGSVVDLLYDRAERLRAGDFWRQRREVPVGAPLRWYTLVDHEVCPALQLRSQILLATRCSRCRVLAR